MDFFFASLGVEALPSSARAGGIISTLTAGLMPSAFPLLQITPPLLAQESSLSRPNFLEAPLLAVLVHVVPVHHLTLNLPSVPVHFRPISRAFPRLHDELRR